MSDFDAILRDAESPARRFGSVRPDLNVRPLDTGFHSFAKYKLLRADRPDLCVIGARPGNGKTALLVQLLRALAKNEQKHTLMFSLEMDTEQLVMRSLQAELGVADDRLKHLPEARIEKTLDLLSQENFYCDDQSGLDINSLRSRAMAFHGRTPLAAIGVDYIQIVRPMEDRTVRREEVMQVVTGLKQLARDLNIPVLALAQMSRDVEKRQAASKAAKPVMSDLQECGGIENYADQIIFLDGAGRRDPGRAGQVDVIIGKNRHGPIGDFVLTFNGETTRFSDYEEVGL